MGDKTLDTTRSSEGPAAASQTEYYLLEYLSHLYGSGVAPQLMRTLLESVDQMRVNVPDGQRALDAGDTILIVYGDTVLDQPQLPLQTLKRFADEYLVDIFSGIHVLPFFPYSSDDGFAVVDYGRVREDLGGWSDISALGEHFQLMFDLVINHCSREHLWFADFINHRQPGRDFFVELPAHANVSAVIRPRNTPLLSQVETYDGPKHVWTTFGDDQIDLNFGNFDVLHEFVKILFDYVDRGAQFIRLDAIAFLWKRLDSASMSLPETHLVVKILRLLLDYKGLNVRLLTETNVPHEENVGYFGQADEAHMVYQFSLAPLLVYSYQFSDGSYLQQWAAELEPPPPGCTYLNFIASHDGIGLRPLENLVPEVAIGNLIALVHERGGFVSMRTGSDGLQQPYEMNIALFSVFGGDAACIPAYVGAHQLLLAFQGVPAIYLRALLGSTNDLLEIEKTGRTRSINRGHLSYSSLVEDLQAPLDIKAQVFARLARSIATRRQQPAFSPQADQRIIPSSAHLLVLKRSCDVQSILVIASFSALEQHLDLQETLVGAPQAEAQSAERTATDLLTGLEHKTNAEFYLAPYQVVWLEL